MTIMLRRTSVILYLLTLLSLSQCFVIVVDEPRAFYTTQSPPLLFSTSLAQSSNGNDLQQQKQQQQEQQQEVESITWDWHSLSDSVFENGDERPIILFDGQCNLCSDVVCFSIDNDPHARFRFVSLQSKIGQSLLLRNGLRHDERDKIMLCTKNNKAFAGSEAVLRIMDGFHGPIWNVCSMVGRWLPMTLRESVYRVVSERRFYFGETSGDSCRLDFEGVYDDRFLADPPEDDVNGV